MSRNKTAYDVPSSFCNSSGSDHRLIPRVQASIVSPTLNALAPDPISLFNRNDFPVRYRPTIAIGAIGSVILFKTARASSPTINRGGA